MARGRAIAGEPPPANFRIARWRDRDRQLQGHAAISESGSGGTALAQAPSLKHYC